jgi:predicted nucleic acid-binding Zn ribbon protein
MCEHLLCSKDTNYAYSPRSSLSIVCCEQYTKHELMCLVESCKYVIYKNSKRSLNTCICMNIYTKLIVMNYFLVRLIILYFY